MTLEMLKRQHAEQAKIIDKCTEIEEIMALVGKGKSNGSLVLMVDKISFTPVPELRGFILDAILERLRKEYDGLLRNDQSRSMDDR